MRAPVDVSRVRIASFQRDFERTVCEFECLKVIKSTLHCWRLLTGICPHEIEPLVARFQVSHLHGVFRGWILAFILPASPIPLVKLVARDTRIRRGRSRGFGEGEQRRICLCACVLNRFSRKRPGSRIIDHECPGD